MANGPEALLKSTALAAGPLSGRPWKNGRFQKKAMSLQGHLSRIHRNFRVAHLPRAQLVFPASRMVHQFY
jgi:hypothetical protein